MSRTTAASRSKSKRPPTHAYPAANTETRYTLSNLNRYKNVGHDMNSFGRMQHLLPQSYSQPLLAREINLLNLTNGALANHVGN